MIPNNFVMKYVGIWSFAGWKYFALGDVMRLYFDYKKNENQ